MRVALVDPSRTVLKIVTRLLEARGHKVVSFADASTALQKIKLDQDIGAVITSGEVPDMSGVELCKKVRQLSGSLRPIYIILMSSSQNHHHVVEALDSGADDFIGKPPVPEELYARLRAAERLRSMQYELIRMATTDPLSGLLNRRAFFERAREICERPGGMRTASAILFDIDNFKKINDSHGHDVGDEVIRAVARVAMNMGSVVGRIGGEEFTIMLDNARLSDAVDIAERLRANVASLRFVKGAESVKLTCSFGVSEWKAGDNVDSLLKRADIALYAAKTSGRNRVVAADARLIATDGQGPADSIRTMARTGAASAPASSADYVLTP